MFVLTPLFKYKNFVQVKGQDSLPDVGQPILPFLGVEMRNDFQLSVFHNLTGKEILKFECLLNAFKKFNDEIRSLDCLILHYVFVLKPDMVTYKHVMPLVLQIKPLIHKG